MPSTSESSVVAARIPAYRAHQLRELAYDRGLSVSGLLDDLVTDAIHQSHRRWFEEDKPFQESLSRQLADSDTWQVVDGGRLEINRKRIDVMTAAGLGVRCKFTLTFDNDLEDGTVGLLRSRDDHYDIRIRSGLSPSDAQDTIWHEIGHMVQRQKLDVLWARKALGEQFLEEDAESYAEEFRDCCIVRLTGGAA